VGNVEKDNKDRFEIHEMFMCQADHDRCFYGIIKRSKDTNGNPHVFSRIIVNDGLIMACAGEQKVLGKVLDEMCVLVLEYGLHNHAGVRIKIYNADYFLN
jgi:hypothetical protein